MDLCLVQNEKFLKNLFRQLDYMGFAYFSYSVKRGEGPLLTVCSCDAWVERYKEQEYFHHDPLLQSAFLFKNKCIPWNDLQMDNDLEYKIMRERYGMSKTVSGVTIAINDGGTQKIISLGGVESDCPFYKRFHFLRPHVFTICQELDHFLANP